MTKNTPFFFNRLAFGIICCLIVFSPMARGSVHAWAKTVIQILVMVSWVVLLVENMITRRRFLFNTNLTSPLLAVTILVMISCAASRHPAAAFEGMLMFFTYVALFFAVINTIRTRKQERIIVYLIIGTALVISVVGVLKLLDMNPFFWWEYVVPGKEPEHTLTGVYVNRNHMAGFMEMVIPLLLVLFLTRQRSIEQKIGMISLVVFFFLVQALTLSRGGWIATFCAMGFMTILLFFQQHLASKKTLLGVVAVTFFISILVLASGPVVNRFMTLQQNDPMENITGRLRVWKGTVAMIMDNPFLGTGPGTFKHAYPAYQVPGHSELRRYAHNDYLNITAELGLLFIPIAMVLVYRFFRTGFQKLQSSSRQKSGLALGCMAGIFAILVHSLSDFNLYIPANTILFTIISGLGVGPGQLLWGLGVGDWGSDQDNYLKLKEKQFIIAQKKSLKVFFWA
jgi:O-antigen ligase